MRLPVLRSMSGFRKHPAAAVILAGLGYLAVVQVIAAMSAAARPEGVPQNWPDDVRATAPALARFDAGWYRSIAVDGYFVGPDGHGNVVFFPLFPAAMRAASRVTGLEPFRAGMAVSALAFLGSLLLLDRRWREMPGGADAGAARLALFLFPWSFFYAAPYTEALFLLASLLAFEGIRTRRRSLALLGGVAAGLTRISALALVPALFLESRTKGARPGEAVVFASAPLVGVSSFLAWSGIRFGDPLLFLHAEAAGWERHSGGFSGMIRTTFERGIENVRSGGILHAGRLVDLLVVIGIAAAAVWLLRERRWGEGLFVLATAGLVVSSGSLASDGRYAVTLFPIFPLIARLRGKPVAWRLFLAVCAAIEIHLVFRFVSGRWVA